MVVSLLISILMFTSTSPFTPQLTASPHEPALRDNWTSFSTLSNTNHGESLLPSVGLQAVTLLTQLCNLPTELNGASRAENKKWQRMFAYSYLKDCLSLRWSKLWAFCRRTALALIQNKCRYLITYAKSWSLILEINFSVQLPPHSHLTHVKKQSINCQVKRHHSWTHVRCLDIQITVLRPYFKDQLNISNSRHPKKTYSVCYLQRLNQYIPVRKGPCWLWWCSHVAPSV